MTVGADKRVRAQTVRTGIRAAGWVELIDGPTAGTRVALGGGAFLLDGDVVKPAKGS
jgi:HlyD family secretion protein